MKHKYLYKTKSIFLVLCCLILMFFTIIGTNTNVFAHTHNTNCYTTFNTPIVPDCWWLYHYGHLTTSPHQTFLPGQIGNMGGHVSASVDFAYCYGSDGDPGWWYNTSGQNYGDCSTNRTAVFGNPASAFNGFASYTPDALPERNFLRSQVVSVVPGTQFSFEITAQGRRITGNTSYVQDHGYAYIFDAWGNLIDYQYYEVHASVNWWTAGAPTTVTFNIPSTTNAIIYAVDNITDAWDAGGHQLFLNNARNYGTKLKNHYNMYVGPAGDPTFDVSYSDDSFAAGQYGRVDFTARTGYVFNYLYNQDTGGVLDKNGQSSCYYETTFGERDEHIVAYTRGIQYANTLYYNSDGGTAVGADTQWPTYPYTSCSHALAGGPSKTGYTFAGWYYGGSPAPNPFTVGSNSYAGDQSATVTAAWSANSYTNYIYYDANGGSGAPGASTATVTYPNTSSTISLSGTVPTRSGYEFIGWYTAADGGSQVAGSATVGSNYVAGDQSITLYAHWRLSNFNMHLDANGGTSPSSVDLTVTMQSSNYWDVSGWTPSKTGYTFNGWWTATSGGTQVYGSNGQCVNGCGYWSGYLWQYAGDVTFYAQWIPNQYYLAYYTNGGLIDTNSYDITPAGNTVTYDAGYPATGWDSSPRTARRFYTFDGWYDRLSGGTKVINSNGTANTSASTYWTSTGTWKYTGDVNLYAQWLLNYSNQTLYWYKNTASGSYDNPSYSTDWVDSKAYNTGWGNTFDASTKVSDVSAPAGYHYSNETYGSWLVEGANNPNAGGIYFAPNKYLLKVSGAGGTGGSAGASGSQNYTMIYNTYIDLLQPTRPGYTFTGWDVTLNY